MMDFTPQNKGKWIAPLPSTNRINNRGKGKEQYKRLGIRKGMPQNTKWHKTKHEMAYHKTRNSMKQNMKWNATKHEMECHKTRNDTTKKAHQLY